MEKSKYAQFPGEVCELLRNMVKRVEQVKSRRTKAFENRDAAEDLIEVGGSESSINRAKEDHSDCVREIKMLARAEKSARNTITESITNADQGTLFEGKVDFTLGQLAALADKADDDEPAQKDPRPVGRPGKVKPKLPDPSKGDGVDDHLKASLNELEQPDDVVQVCLDKGITTIGHLVEWVESKGQIVQTIGMSGKKAESLLKALAKFRKAHRSAAREVEGAL